MLVLQKKVLKKVPALRNKKWKRKPLSSQDPRLSIGMS